MTVRPLTGPCQGHCGLCDHRRPEGPGPVTVGTRPRQFRSRSVPRCRATAGVPASTNRRCCSPPSDRYNRRTLRGANRLLLRQWRGRTSESAARPSASRTATTTTCWSSFEPRSSPCSVPAHRREVLRPHRGPKLRRTRPDIKWQVGAAIWGLRLAQDYPAIRRRASGAAIRRA